MDSMRPVVALRTISAKSQAPCSEQDSGDSKGIGVGTSEHGQPPKIISMQVLFCFCSLVHSRSDTEMGAASYAQYPHSQRVKIWRYCNGVSHGAKVANWLQPYQGFLPRVGAKRLHS